MPPLELLLNRKEKIEELKLYTLSLQDEIHQHLHLFPNLKSLYLDYPQEMHLELFFSKEMKRLKSISIIFGRYSKNFYSSHLNMDDILTYPNTRQLMIYYYRSSYYDDNFILYIMKKFPNLESLQLVNSLQGCKRKSSYAFPTMDCLFRFLIYLSKMKKHVHTSIITNNFTAQLVKKFLSFVIDQQEVYYKNTNISLGIRFNFKDLEEENNNSPDNTEYITEYITMKYLKPGYKKSKELILSVVYNVLQETTFHSHLQLFREVGNMNITRLSIFSNNSARAIPIILDEIFIQFSKLENIVIINVSDFILNKEGCLVEETINSTIKYMQYKDCTLSKDMFPMISKRCQNLKTLDLTNCRYTNNNEDQVISRYFPILMSNTCLEELLINYEYTRAFLYKKVFIRLITNNKKPRYCKITTIPGLPIVDFPEQDCTEAHYNICLDDEECGVFDIHCESVVKLIVQFETVDCERDSTLIEKCKFLNVEYEVEDFVFRAIKEYIEEDL